MEPNTSNRHSPTTIGNDVKSSEQTRSGMSSNQVFLLDPLEAGSGPKGASKPLTAMEEPFTMEGGVPSARPGHSSSPPMLSEMETPSDPPEAQMDPQPALGMLDRGLQAMVEDLPGPLSPIPGLPVIGDGDQEEEERELALEVARGAQALQDIDHGAEAVLNVPSGQRPAPAQEREGTASGGSGEEEEGVDAQK